MNEIEAAKILSKAILQIGFGANMDTQDNTIVDALYSLSHNLKRIAEALEQGVK